MPYLYNTFNRFFPLLVVPVLILLYFVSERQEFAFLSVLFTWLVVIGIFYARRSASTAMSGALDSPPRILRPLRDTTEDRRFFFVSFVLISSSYLVVAIARIHFNQWNLNNDAYSYLQIARQYADGHFVVRGYWSPLLSWLTAPLISLGLSPELAMRYVIAISGLPIIGASAVIARRFQLQRSTALVFTGITALLVLAYRGVTADIMGVALLMLYFVLILSPSAAKKPIMVGFFAGVMAGIAYFARSYNLVFILAHLVIYGIWVLLQGRSFHSFLSFAFVLLLTLGIVISPWIYLLSIRYARFTFSTSAAHTRGLVAPDVDDSIACLNGSVLCDRPTDILFPWEDHLPELQPNYDLSPFASSANFRYQLKLIFSNIQYFAGLNIGWFAIGLVSGLCVILYWAVTPQRNNALFLLLTAAVYVGGYMLTLAMGGIRYYIFAYIMIFLTYSYCVQHIYLSINVASARTALVLSSILLIGISFASPVLDSVEEMRQIVSGAEQPLLCRPVDSQRIAQYLEAPFALVEPGIRNRNMIYISYFTQKRTLGFLNADRYSPSELNTLLTDAGIRTVLVRSDLEATSNLPADYAYLASGSVSFCGTSYLVLQVPYPE